MTKNTFSKIQNWSLRIFITLMITEVILVLFMIWTEPENMILQKLVPTIFIIGFANALIWITSIIYLFYKKRLEE